MVMYVPPLPSLNLDPAILESDSVDLEQDRKNMIDTFCDEDMTENWENIADMAPPWFVDDMYRYGKDNLIRVNVFIR